MLTDFQVRSEFPEDREAIDALLDRSFEDAVIARGGEKEFVNEVRSTDNYIPGLAMVAARGDEIVAFGMISRTEVVDGDEVHPTLVLGPICTAPEVRGEGIGAGLIVALLGRTREMGFGTVFLAGGHKYYKRFGFEPTHKHEIRSQYDFPESLQDNIMVRELTTGALAEMKGVVRI